LNSWTDEKMWRLLSALPIGVVLADLVYGFVLNVLQGLDLQRAVPDSEGVLAVTPDIAFNSLQIVANGGMSAVVGFGLVVLFLLNRSVLRRQVWKSEYSGRWVWWRFWRLAYLRCGSGQTRCCR
jgi:porphobilinogen synthase (delta-aminolevulinic acid dehydratase) (fragment)